VAVLGLHRHQKVVLATFVGTLTLSLWLLWHVEGNSVPNIGVTVAGAAASASLLLLLYLNRFTHSLRPVAVAAAVSWLAVASSSRHRSGRRLRRTWMAPCGACCPRSGRCWCGSTVRGRSRRSTWRMFALGRERTIEQDPAFALRVLVDIAIRALSPAVNDPTTAVQVLGGA
jgi:uncharacterized membrane protein